MSEKNQWREAATDSNASIKDDSSEGRANQNSPAIESAGIGIDDLKGMEILWQDIRGVGLEPGKDGKFNITVDFENPITRKVNSISIPEDLARFVFKVMTTKAPHLADDAKR